MAALDNRIASRESRIMPTFEYVTSPSGTVHVCVIGADRTLCGKSITCYGRGRGWTIDGETVSASDATCARCRAIARSRARRVE